LPGIEFKFVVTDVKLTKAQQTTISRAIAQAAALALAEIVPPNAVSVPIGVNRWWYGIPAPDLFKQLQTYGNQVAGGG
jgi:hypothetical protein